MIYVLVIATFMSERIYIVLRIVLAAVSLLSAPAVRAFAPDSYARHSVLSHGRWVKLKVMSEGMYRISLDDLERWGFHDVTRVSVYGYGAEPAGDALLESDYIDDLPQAPCEVTSRGLVFYARGAEGLTVSNGRYVMHKNGYTDAAYYFLGESEPAEPGRTGIPGAVNGVTSFTEVLSHEIDLVSPGATGHEMLGEDFRFQRSAEFVFDLTGKSDDNVWTGCRFAVKNVKGASTLALSVNGSGVSPVTSIAAGPNDSHQHYRIAEMSHDITVDGDVLTLGLDFSTKGQAALARLDRITVNYNRRLAMTDGVLTFSHSSPSLILEGVRDDTRIWDVTDARRFLKVDAAVSHGTAKLTASSRGLRRYVAWNPDADMKSPVLAGEVYNSDLHAMAVPDMVIFTPKRWSSYAESLAALHRNSSDNLDVAVVAAEDVYNEFASGAPDFNAFRRMLKMLWDRGGGSASAPSKLKYALMLGRGHHDHRRITASAQATGYPILPQWQSVDGSSDNTSYTTEDYLAFLLDGSGVNPGSDYHCIAVGRIPVTSDTEARMAVDKISAYINGDNDESDWKINMVMTADDGDNGEHTEQMERIYNQLMSTDDGGREMLYHKVYVDASPLVDKVAVEAHDRMMRLLGRGTCWWWFVGHATTYSWTGEGLLTADDIRDMNLRRQPLLFAATCDFLRWDADGQSGAELLFMKPGGIIGAVAATRPVYMTYNRDLTIATARMMTRRDESGELLPVGEVMRRAKNELTSPSDVNKLRYVLLGDPALRPAGASFRAVLDSIAGQAVHPDSQVTVKGRQQLVMKGRITDSRGRIVSSFNGVVNSTIYDAEYSTITEGRNDGKQVIFEQQGDRLWTGRDTVVNGHFSINVTMPGEISSNFRHAALSMTALSVDGRDASGVNRDFYVYGYDETAIADEEPPVIELFGLNGEDFVDGQTVNESPMVIARVTDNVGINISNAGIGHQMSLMLDGNKACPDVPHYYSPGSDGGRSGTIAYPLSGLSPGRHTLRLRVWDTSNNMAESTVSFKVVKGLAPDIVELYTDANPAVDMVKFYIRHNRPDAMLQVKLTVYDLSGRTVWSTRQNGRSDMFVTAPIVWNLSDNGGGRVSHGLYIYKVTISADGGSETSATRKLAVAPR